MTKFAATETMRANREQYGILPNLKLLGEAPGRDWFDLAFWRGQGAITSPKGGRGAAHIVSTPCGKALLRHYRRGGLVARFNTDRYLWRGENAVRSFSEFRVLESAVAAGLPVPEPLAAHYSRSGVWYRADILVKLIDDARTLAESLALPARIPWAAIGCAIARMHAWGLWHADLNAHNLLIDHVGKVWVIDFDRARRKAPRMIWMRRNLARLKASLAKLGAPRVVMGFENEHWPALVEAHRRCATGLLD